MCKFCFARTSCPLDVVRIIGGILYLLLRPALYCTHSVDITHQVSLVVYMKQFWLFRLLSVSMIFFVSLLAQSFMMLHFCQKKEQNLDVTSVYSLLGLVRTRTLQLM